jgi:hypothetical protein
MWEHPNTLKQYKSLVDEQGNYRVYTVYPSGNLFIFENWDCTETPAQGGVGSRKAYDEYDNAADAIARFKEYIEAWEPDAKIDLS